MFLVALFVRAKKWKQLKSPPAGEERNRLIYLYNGILFSP